ncbi:hypothetical protein ACI79P_05840 [Blastococcus sp. SYSU DS0510]
MTLRERHVLGPASRPCSLCGNTEVVLVESRNVRRFHNRLNPAWDPHTRVFEACSYCGARSEVSFQDVARAS